MAEETNTNTGAVNGEGTATQTGTAQETKPQTFDEVLSNKEYQSEFDKRVSKALETAKAKWQDDFDKTLADKMQEANKLAKMNADDKAKYEREKQEAEYTKRIAEVTKRELKAEAKDQFASEGLPIELADALVYTDAQSCKNSMDAVKTAFSVAVEKAVNEKLKGNTPKGGAQAPDFDKMSDEEYYNTKYKK